MSRLKQKKDEPITAFRTTRSMAAYNSGKAKLNSINIQSSMEARPKLTIELTKVDKTLEGLCLIILILLWTGIIAGFSKLPDEIPSHFNASGQADDYSNKTSIFNLPIVVTILYLGMTILNRYPHVYNYSATLTMENAGRLYKSATRLIRILKLAVIVIFTGIVLLTCNSAITKGDGLGVWFLPVVLALMFVPTIIYLLTSWNSTKSFK